MTRPFVLGLLVLATLGGVAQARQTPTGQPTAAFGRCMNGPSGATTVGALGCIEAEIKVQDRRLNTAYQANRVAVDVNPKARDALIKAQRAWIAFRDADCASVLAQSEGTIASINARMCVLDHTRGRADALEQQMQP